MAIDFAMKPGERLNEGEFARVLKMSRAPVREAMNRLVSEDLLTVIPNQGFSCRRLSASEVNALCEVRADLEAAAVGRIPAEALAQGLRSLAKQHAAMRREARKACPKPWRTGTRRSTWAWLGCPATGSGSACCAASTPGSGSCAGSSFPTRCG